MNTPSIYPWVWAADDPGLDDARAAAERAIKAQREAAISAHLEAQALESIGIIKGLSSDELTKAKNQARVNEGLALARLKTARVYLASLPESPDTQE